MERGKRKADQEPQQELFGEGGEPDEGDDGVLESTLVCKLTGERRASTPQEEVVEDMERDVRGAHVSSDDGKAAVENVLCTALVAKPGTGPDELALGVLEQVLGSLSRIAAR